MPTALDFQPLALDLGVVALILSVFVGDLLLGAKSGKLLGLSAGLSLFVLFCASFQLNLDGRAFGGAYVGSAFSTYLKRLFLLSGGLAMLGSLEHVSRHYPHRQTEFHLMTLCSVLGMTLLPGARDLILLIVAFELMSIPLFVLAAYAKTDTTQGPLARAPEAALKLYLVSVASTALTLFGLSWVYGMAGTTAIDRLVAAPASPMLTAGTVLLLAGMAFKIGAVPFHFWVADTYQGANTPFVAFLAVAPKLAGFAALALVLQRGLDASAMLRPLLVLLAGASIVLGNLWAVTQTNVKRLLAFSGISHIGLFLLAFIPGDAPALTMLLFYGGAYVLTNVGAFLVVEAVEDDRGDCELSAFQGLVYRSPTLAFAMLVFLLSLAGIPFVIGFWGKLYIFLAAWKAGLHVLVVVGAVASVVGLFYYLQIARAMFMKTPDPGAGPVPQRLGLTFAIAVCLTGVVVLGLFPAPLLDQAERAAATFVLGPRRLAAF
ncbi:MAG: NADH-quinone oxidoreductase subunit N [Polyangiaceae bacterium]